MQVQSGPFLAFVRYQKQLTARVTPSSRTTIAKEVPVTVSCTHFVVRRVSLCPLLSGPCICQCLRRVGVLSVLDRPHILSHLLFSSLSLSIFWDTGDVCADLCGAAGVPVWAVPSASRVGPLSDVLHLYHGRRCRL